MKTLIGLSLFENRCHRTRLHLLWSNAIFVFCVDGRFISFRSLLIFASRRWYWRRWHHLTVRSLRYFAFSWHFDTTRESPANVTIFINERYQICQNVNNIFIEMGVANTINAFVIAMRGEKFNQTSVRRLSKCETNLFISHRGQCQLSADIAFQQNFECLTEIDNALGIWSAESL